MNICDNGEAEKENSWARHLSWIEFYSFLTEVVLLCLQNLFMSQSDNNARNSFDVIFWKLVYCIQYWNIRNERWGYISIYILITKRKIMSNLSAGPEYEA